jgi:CRP-like cAMP-binding protein
MPESSQSTLLAVLRSSPFFRGMPKEATAEISKLFREEYYPEGSIILKEAQRARQVFLLAQGKVAISIRTPKGDVIIEIITRKGEIFGWSGLVPPRIYTASGKALSDSRVFAAEGRALERLFQRYPSFGWLFLQRLSNMIATRLYHTRTLLIETLA